MKKILLSFAMCVVITPMYAQRYYTEVFSSTTVTPDVVYGQNIQVYLTPTPTLIDLKADIYEPVGDTMTARPTVIMIHTGSFLPVFYNGQTTGIKTDSAITEMCRQFARRGFTAIAMDYRLGWNPTALGPTGQDIRTGTILQAVGRGIQDAKACVRYFRNNANTTNNYHIDESKIILGGMGTGGYIALGYATIDKYSEINLSKFLAAANNPTYGFTAGVTYFDSTYWGNVNGYGGMSAFNNVSSNNPGVSNSISFVFNMGGALGDSSWLETGDVPMVCFHPTNDPFAPYMDGPVIVPTTGQFVVDVSGSHTVVKKADALQNNSLFQNNTWTDPYTTRANQVNDGYDGLFPFEQPGFPPFNGQAGPWEWYDSTTVYFICQNLLGFTQGHTDTIWYGSLATNPTMSSAKGHAYIDTTMNYLIPRLIASLPPLSINEISPLAKSITVYPNPATNNFTVNISDAKAGPPMFIEINDATGRMMKRIDNPKGNKIIFDRNGIEPGAYFIKVKFNKGEVVKKIILQ